MDIVLLIAGLGLVLLGANMLTDWSAALAKRFGLSEFVIGLTIVAIGTSAPELVVSVISAVQGNGDVAVGNILGSNMFNTLVIIGITAIIIPVPFTADNIRKDIPFALLASFILLVVVSDVYLKDSTEGVISRGEGILMLFFWIVFMVYTLFSAKNGVSPETSKKNTVSKSIWLMLLMIGLGLVGLIYGGKLFLDSGISLARSIGISESVIAITLMAGGTSLPELAACVVSALKGKPQIALGNVIGSNISNIFLILGLSASIHPLKLGNILPADMVVLTISSLLIFLTAYTFKKRAADRIEGIVFLLLYVAYIIWLIMR